MPAITLLLLNYLTWQDTLRYVTELKQQTGIRLFLLVVDNCSPNESFEQLSKAFVDDPDVTVIQSERNGGYAYGNNFGLCYLAGRPTDFILISNNDVRLDDPRLIRNLADEYERLALPAFAAPCMFVNGKEDRKHQAWQLPRYRDDLFGSLRTLYWLADRSGLTNRYKFPANDCSSQRVDCLNGAFFLGKKSVFDRLGPWDENTFLYGEESILGQKIRALGLNNYLVRSLRFHHELGGTTRRVKSAIQLQRFWLDSAVYYQQKYRGAGRVKVFFLQWLFGIWIAETVLLNGMKRLIPARFRSRSSAVPPSSPG